MRSPCAITRGLYSEISGMQMANGHIGVHSMPSLLIPLDERLYRASQLVIASRVYWDLWFYYDGADTPHPIVMTMQGFNEYFRFTPHALLLAFTVYTAAVFERRKDTMNLPTLAKEM